MDWLILAVAASLMWSVSNLIDKFLLEKWLKNPLLSLDVFFVIGIIVGTIIVGIHGLPALSVTNLMLVLIAGALSAMSAVFYFMALSIEEVSRVVPLFNVSPLFILVLASIFLGEVFSQGKYLGIALLVIGSVLISIKKIESKRRFHWGKSMWFMLGCIISTAFVQIITKYLLGFADYLSIYGYLRFGCSIALIPLVAMTGKELVSTIKRHGKRVVGLITASEGTATVAYLVFTLAVSLGPVTLVNSVCALQPLFVLGMAILFSHFFPHILKEEMDRHTLALKVMAIIMMIAGTVLVA